MISCSRAFTIAYPGPVWLCGREKATVWCGDSRVLSALVGLSPRLSSQGVLAC